MKSASTTIAFFLFLFLSISSNAQVTTSSQWTWMKGDSTGNSPSIYGTKGVSAAANMPGTRYGSLTWTDADGNLWLFGGKIAGGVLNDLWKYNPGTNQWTWVNGDSTRDQPGIYGTLGSAAASNKPGARFFSVSWTDASGNFWLFGGSEGSGRLNDLWKYYPAANRWTWVNGDSTRDQYGVYGTLGTAAASNKPGASYGNAGWTDVGGNLWLFGGDTSNDLWKYNIANNLWTWVSGAINPDGVYGTMGTAAAANIPGARHYPTAWTDSAGNLWLFGGLKSGNNFFNDLWKYDPFTNLWTWISGAKTLDQPGVYGTLGTSAASNMPGSRYFSANWRDTAGDFLLFGGIGFAAGSSRSGFLNDLWKYNPATNKWTWINGASTADQPGLYGTQGMAAAGNRPGARAYAANWTDVAGNFWLFSGNGFVSNDFWKFRTSVSPTQFSLTVNDVSHNESNSGTTLYSFTVSLSAPAPAGGVTFDISTADGTSTAGSDYIAKSLTSQTIDADSTTYTFDVLVNGNVAVETDESFFVNITNVAGAVLTDGQGIGTIVNDECFPINIAPVTLPNATQGIPYSQPFIITGGSGSHTLAFTGSYTPGLSVSGDNILSGTPTQSGSYTFTLNVTDPACTGASKTYTLLVKSSPNLTINDVSHNESNSGTTLYSFTVGLSAPAPAGGVTFDISTADGTSIAGSDYIAKSLTSQTIAADSATYTFNVQVNGDTAVEPDETFIVNITNVTGAVVTDGQGLGIIANDDCMPIIIAPATLPNATQGTPYSQSIIITGGGGGSRTTTFTGSFPPGLSLSGNNILSGTPTQSGSYTFTVMVNTATGCTVSASRSYTIVVNSPAPPNLIINDVSHNESNSGTTLYSFTVGLSAPAPAGGVTFDISTADGTSIAGSDYIAKSLTSQTIAADSATYTFNVQVNGDIAVEPDETFIVNITNVTGAVITDGQGIGTITDDDTVKSIGGLAAYYPFNGSAADISGNGNNGTVYGAALATDRFGNSNSAYSFNGNSDYIECPSLQALDNAAGLSVSLWIKALGLNNTTNNAQFIVSRGSERDGGHFNVYLTDNPNNSSFIGEINSPFLTGKGCASSVAFQIPHYQWHHVVLSYDRVNISLYVDDVLSCQTPYTDELAANAQPVLIGRHLTPGFEYFVNGLIDDVAFYNKGLSQSEVDSLYGNYQSNSLSIRTFTPATAANGDTVKITGYRFTGTDTVSFGGTLAKSFIVVSDSIILAVVDTGSSGSVSVTAPGGTATLAGFIYCVPFTPSVSVAANPSGAICAGTSVTFTAAPANNNYTPTYYWTRNRAKINGAAGATYKSDTLTNNDTIRCVLISNAPCATKHTDISNAVTVKVNQPTSSVTKDTICAGNTYTFNGSTYSTAGTYMAHLPNTAGCDSTATLMLFVKDTTGSVTTTTIADGDSVIFNNQVFKNEGTYIVHLINREGCDSAAQLFVTVITPDLAVQHVTSNQTIIAPGDAVTVSWNVANVGKTKSHIDWTERIYMQSPYGQNRTFLKQIDFSNNNLLDSGQIISRSDVVNIPAQLYIGDQGVFVVELIPGSVIHEASGSDTNNTSIQQPPWTIKKLLTLELSTTQITEGSSEVITAVINRTGSLSDTLTVNINLKHPGRFSYPSPVTIPAGQAGVSFTISATDNNKVEGTITDTLVVSASSFQPAKADLAILDNDRASLSISDLPATAMEGITVTFKVNTNLAPVAPLQVFLTSGSQARFPVPSSVTIPAGALSTDVTVRLVQDSIPEVDLDVEINVGALDQNPAKGSIQVKDDDVPGLELVLQTNTISESAGFFATQATLRRKANSNPIAFTAKLSADPSNTLILPVEISLAQGENEKSFNIGAVDNSLADGQRKVSITASIFVATCGCSAPPASAGSVSADITVSDNDGPALQLTAAELTLPEGSANAGFLRVTRNTSINNSLLVNLASSDTTEATIPVTVIIPGGQSFADVPITTINDGVSDGNQQVYFYATDSGFSPGSVWVIVTDLNKPDLQIPSVIPSNVSIQAMTVFNYQVSIKNTGFATAPTGVLVRGYLSLDEVIDNSDTLILENIVSVPIAAGQTIQVLNAAMSPNLPGHYKLLFWVNPDASLSEILATNNTSQPVNLTIIPDYTATANVSLPYFIQGTHIPVTGHAVRINGTPAANEQVEIFVITNALRREFLATTDGAGNYSAEFMPLAKEAGYYTIGASFPGMGDTTEQDAFNILGVRINEGDIPQFKVTLNDTLKGSLVIQNLSNKSLANFSMVPFSLPNGARFNFDTIPVFTGNSTENLSYTVIGSALSSGTNFEVATLQAMASEGAVQTADVFYFCQAAAAYVVPDITDINITVSQSTGERLVELRLVNRGRGSTGNVTINLPQVNWMSNITPKILPSMAAGDTALVILKFLALPEVPFDYPVTGSIGINTQNGNSFSIPFSFEKVSETVGTVKITVTNQFTYYSEGAPKVRGAHVQVKNYFSGVIYAEGFTDSAGVFIAGGIPEGRNRVTVDKDKHLPYDGTITMNPGDTISSTIFLNYQAITFNWNVVPTAIQDKYDITLTSQFETNIPIPVVTIEMPDTMPQLFGSDVYAFNITLTNRGLITANDVALILPATDPEYEFVNNYLPADLLAQQSIQIPVLMRRRTSPVISGASGSTSIAAISEFLGMQASQYSAVSSQSLNCRDFAGVNYWYPCLFEILRLSNGVTLHYRGRVCDNTTKNPITPSNNGGNPCAICPASGPLSPASGTTPVFQVEKKSCIKCIKDIADALITCVPVPIPKAIKAVYCVYKAWNKNAGVGDYVACIPGVIPKPIKCLKSIGSAIQTCLSPGPGDSSKSVTKFNTTRNPYSKNSSAQSVFQEIFSNFQVVTDAYQARENWGKEYFGDMIFNDAWEDISPKLENYIVSLDTISQVVQTKILSEVVGYDIQSSTLQTFFTRWNTSLYAKSLNILEPNAQYPNIINWRLVKAYSDSMVAATNYAVNRGFESVYDMYEKQDSSLNEIVAGQKNEVCASITVQFSQQLTMTREAFEGTLEIFNGHPTDAMDSLTVNILITDANGVPSNGLFEIQTKSLTNLSDVTGTGTIDAQQKGSVKFLFIPEIGAAPQTPKLYNFGGSVRYWDPYAQAIVTLPLANVQLTVNPSPNLMLHYFMERNILGDDALTSPEIEPSIPAELAVMVENQGYGPAVNMTISSAQPKIIDNEKGLAINFNLIGSNFQGQPAQLGVTNINFGTIPPLETRIGQWYFTSSLLGKFVSYDAEVVHANSFGNPDLSLVKGVKLHELTKSIREYGAKDDGINDFLVNDIFDVYDEPDIIYFSQGIRTAKVNQAPSGSFSSAVLPPTFTDALTVTASDTGWNYIKLDDPGNGLYELVSVTRSDGQVIPLDNAWLTFVTLPVSRPPVYENKFHFVDSFPSLLPVTYTVVWKPKNFNVPAIVSIEGAPNGVTSTQVYHLKVVFDKAIDSTTFTPEDLTLTFQGGSNIINSSVVITRLDSSSFDVDLSAITAGNGFYNFTAQAANVTDIYGISGTAGKQVTWTQFLNVPAVQKFQAIPDSHIAASFDTIQVLFNLPIDEATVTPARFTIMKDSVLQSGTLTIDSVRSDHKLFYLSGLKNILTTSGTYILTVDLPNIQSTNHIAGITPQSVSLTVDNAGPVIVKLEKSNVGGLDAQHIPFVNIQFNEDVFGFNTASVQLKWNGEVLPLSITQLSNTDLKSWTAGNFGLLTYPDGNYTFTVNTADFTDAIGNHGSSSQQVSWTVDRSVLVTVTNLTVTPDLGFSNSDGITSVRSLHATFSLSANASQVTVSQEDLSGEAVLTIVPDVAAGAVSLPFTLLAGGNTGIKVTATGSNGGTGTAHLDLSVDEIPLSGEWLFDPNQNITAQVDTIPISFSSKLLSNTGLSGAVQFKRNGNALPTGNLSFEMLNDTVYNLSGLRQAGSPPGNYELIFNMQPFSKYTSGKAGTGSANTSWTVQRTNLAPVAKAGNDTTVTSPGVVMLNGSATSDPDLDSITYSWIAPAGIVLSDSTSATPSFNITTANQGNTYSFLLIASDGSLFSTDVVDIVVNLTATSVSFSGLAGNYCISSEPVSLIGTPAGGTFSGPGISGNTFDPSVAGAGRHLIMYSKDGQSTSQNTTVTALTAPTFVSIERLCSGSIAPALPTTSTNGIAGTWSPASISNTTSATYTFTPIDGQCATADSIIITVIPTVTPAFASIDPICYGSAAPVLPTTSTNGIAGTWNPGTVSNTATATYTFTPTGGQCAVIASLTVTVEGSIITYHPDADRDGHGDENRGISGTTCYPPAGYILDSSDCNDNNATVYPGAPELCDGLDNNCNGSIDEGLTNFTFYKDDDRDGYGDPKESISACTAPRGYVDNNQDCRDHNASAHPGAPELCDGLDNNCNGQIDEGFTNTTFYKDDDKDGYGNSKKPILACIAPTGYVADNEDCNDDNAAVYPGAPELCDGLDNNCNGIIDEGLTNFTFYKDDDRDGYGDPKESIAACTAPPGYVDNNGDCRDHNASVHPGVPELCDGLDNNCNGQIDEGFTNTTFYKDDDKDGYGNPKKSILACIAPHGYVSNNQDCNDDNPGVYPDAPELCDGLDNNCDGVIDEGSANITFYYKDDDRDGYGDPKKSVAACTAPPGYVNNNGDCRDHNASVHPGAPELCDGLDNNCNGVIDEGCLTRSNSVKQSSHQQNTSTVNKRSVLENNLSAEQAKKLRSDTKFSISARPVPTFSQFEISFRGDDYNEKVRLKVFDGIGRLIETKGSLNIGQTLTLGNKYKPGSYIIEATQGRERRTIKVIKL